MGRLPRRLLVELLLFTALILAAVLLILTAGQLQQIGDLLLAAGPHAPWLPAIGGGLLILLEAALPLAGLLSAGLVYGRLRAEDAWIARAALGLRPEPALLPALAIGILLGGLAACLAHGPVPTAVTDLRGTLIDAAGAALRVTDHPLKLPGGGVALRVSGAPDPADAARDDTARDDTARGDTVRSDTVWAALPTGAGPLLVRSADARLAVDPATGQATLALSDAELGSPDARIRVAEARLVVPAAALGRRLGMFGPPNALTTAELDQSDVHHRFTAHRRSALPAMAPLWALLGALLGARAGGPIAVAAGAGAVGLAYWLLRTGELSARAGFMSPALAAWAPALILALVLLWIWCRDASLARAAR